MGKGKYQYINQVLKTLFVFTLCGFFSSNKLSAQPHSSDPDWMYDTLIKGVEFYHSIVDCNGKNVVFLKFNNKNNNKVEVSWKEVFVTKQFHEKREGVAGIKKIVILSKQEISASECSETLNKICLVKPQDVNLSYEAVIEKFEFSDITISFI